MSNMLNLFSRPDWSGKNRARAERKGTALSTAWWCGGGGGRGRGRGRKERKSVELAENGADG